ncbi:MAG: capsid cement protein [Pseudomonadota bacterium]
MARPGQIVTFRAPAPVAARAIVTFGAADGEVVAASAVSNTLLGVAEQIGSRDNGTVDVILSGIAEVVAGGNITRGMALTVNAQGQAVAVSAGTDSVIGIAMQNAVANDIIDVLILQG